MNTAIDNYKNKKNRNATTRATLESARGKAAIKSGKLGQDIAAKEATLNDETYKKDVDTIRKDMVAHNQAIQTGKETVEKCNTQITTITGAIEKIATAKTGNAEATNATQVTLTAEEKTKLGFEADVIELKTSEENQIKTIGQWQESYTACLGEINRLEGSVSSLQGTIDKMPDKDESGAENTAKAAKNEELRRVKQELDEKKNEKTKLEAQIQVGEKTLADIVKDRDAAQSSVAYSEKKMGELRTQLAQYVDIDKLLVSEQAEALRQQGVLGAASSNLNAQVDTLVSSYADTESFIADAEDARENKVKEVKAEIKDLKKEKAALDKAIAKADQLLGTQQQPEKPESNKQTTSGSFYGNDNKPLFNISDDGNLDDPAPNEDDDRYDEDGHRFKK